MKQISFFLFLSLVTIFLIAGCTVIAAETSSSMMPKDGKKLYWNDSYTTDNYAHLEIKNSMPENALIIETKAGKLQPIVAIFIRSGSNSIITADRGGNDLYYEYGTEWNNTIKEFDDGKLFLIDGLGYTPNPNGNTHIREVGYEIILDGTGKSIERDFFPKIVK